MMAMIQVVTFDCDGVMFDSREANAAYYNRVLAQFSRSPLTADQLAFTHMNTVDASLRFLFPDEKEYQAAQAFRRTLTYLPFVPYMRIEPHLKPLLRRLRPACKTAVATNRTDTMHRVLEDHDLTGDFDLVVGALDVPRPKPHPDSLLKIAGHFAVAPEEMIFIGDSTLDAEASAAAGVPFVAYQNRELPAIHHIDALDQVAGIVERSGVRLPA
ncbi:MAG: HAD family hydrolase [Deltaproteobacteria bacterium]|nr:HAD family hydrolase [Deltaproteobacteria bacterium]RLB94594.1 MAG: HAD family hydrolase [Deltaproteobacteria bacterium]